MASVGLSSAGTRVYYAFETEAGTRPTTGWKEIEDLTATPDYNEEPEQLDYTPLSEEKQHLTIPGLRPAAGSANYTANLTDAFMDAWDTLCNEYDTKKEEGLGLWFVTVIKGLKRSFYMQVTPTRLGAPGLEVDSIVSIDAYVSPNSSGEWLTDKPTVA